MLSVQRGSAIALSAAWIVGEAGWLPLPLAGVARVQLVKSSTAQQKLMLVLAYSSQQSSYSAAAPSMPWGC